MEEECKHKRIIRTEKESYCEECGLVMLPELIGNIIEYDDQKDRYYRREPTSFRYYDDGIGTVMPIEGHMDAKGKKLTASQRQLVHRLRRASKLNPKKSYTQIHTHTRGYVEIEKITSTLGTTPQIRDTAVMLYKMAYKKGCMRGRVVETSAAACVWLAYRCSKRVPPTVDKIIKSMTKETNARAFNRSIKIIKHKLGLKYDTLSVESYIIYLTNRLNIDNKTRDMAMEIYKRYAECRETKPDEMIKRYNKHLCHINSKKPQKDIDIHIPQPSFITTAATSVYMAVSKSEPRAITQEMICEIAGVTEVTLRNQKAWMVISEKIMA